MRPRNHDQDIDRIISANNRSALNAANGDKQEKKDFTVLRAVICAVLLMVIFAGFAIRLFKVLI